MELISTYSLSTNIFLSLGIACAILWFFSRPSPGPGYWMCGMFCQILGWLMFASSLESDAFWLNIFGTVLLVEGEVLVAAGICKFLGDKLPRYLFYVPSILITVFIVWHFYVNPVTPSKQVTIFLFYSSLIPLYIAYKLLTKKGKRALFSAQVLAAVSFLSLSMSTWYSGFTSYLYPQNGNSLVSFYNSDVFLASVNLGLPVFVVTLFSLAVLTLKRIILEREESESVAMNNAERFEKLMNISSAGLLILRRGLIYDANPKLEDMLAIERKKLLGQSLIDILGLENEPEFEVHTSRSDYEIKVCDGRVINIEMKISNIDAELKVVEIKDITNHKRLETELRALATIDPLTNALNRRAFYEQASKILERSKRERHLISIALLDLDYFKKVNDTYGHSLGDECLSRFSKKCIEMVRASDLFARYGGEEFIMLLPDTNLEEAKEILERIRAVWAKEKFTSNNIDFFTTVSIGVTEVDLEQKLSVSEHKADLALYKSKQAGRNCVTASSL